MHQVVRKADGAGNVGAAFPCRVAAVDDLANQSILLVAEVRTDCLGPPSPQGKGRTGDAQHLNCVVCAAGTAACTLAEPRWSPW